MPYLFSLPVTFVDFALCGMLFILNFKHQPKYLPSHLLVKPASCILPLHKVRLTIKVHHKQDKQCTM